MRIIGIVARDKGGLVGSNGTLPWSCPEDLAHFKQCTLGHAVVMGRATWESLPGPLLERENIVLGSSKIKGQDLPAHVTPVLTPSAAIEAAESLGKGQLYVIGGPRTWASFALAIDAWVETQISREVHPMDSRAGPRVYFPARDRAVWSVSDTYRKVWAVNGEPTICRVTRYERY